MNAAALGSLLAAVPLLAGAAWLRPPAAAAGAARVRALARPFVLPLLWRGLREARIEEPPEAMAARGQQLLALVPTWTDGNVLFASQLALAASARAHGAAEAADRLLAGLALLEQARRQDPAGTVEYLTTAASFVEIASARDPALATELRDRLGEPPDQIADAFLRRAEAASPSESIADRRTYLLATAIAAALRTEDDARALATIERMRQRLSTAVDRQLAEQWSASLARLDGFLRGDPSVTRDTLKDDPLLRDMVEALNARGPR
ncbi:MAG: hypothetical protein R3F56_05250 [Planctomycetota bacterium]